MRALLCRELGPLDGLEVVDTDPPVAGPGQVVVDVAAAGVNYVDGLFVQGRYQILPPVPFVPGGELAGTVAQVGDGVDGVAVGDRVVASPGLGAFAEQVAVPAAAVLPVPDGVDLAVAATMLQSYGTARFALTRRTAVAPDEWVLVLGAGGGVGLAAIDVARDLGARVVAAASSAEKLEAARAAGADATIDYTTVDLKAEVRAITDGGADVVVDPVGGPHAEPALRATRWLGRYLVIGFAGGGIPALPANLVLLNNRTVVGVDWGAWAGRNRAENREMLLGVLADVAAGRLRPTAPATRPLADAAAAMGDLLERRITGKVALVP
ncbi:MAG TPA: NADPH:quinone oxidoreductase family protein [Acidimicrobiales bacterium]|nr:NADPH:quinone oxidoreductase family protein [Acidimicrobiales bacterium]